MDDRPRRTDFVVVANRLPVRRVGAGDQACWETSPGGLVSALRPVLQEGESTWVGWTGETDLETRPFEKDGIWNHPVRLSEDEIKAFYHGFSNRILWPLYHDAIRPPQYNVDWWWSYVTVNRRFADAVVRAASPQAAIWIHDYHLQLVPAMIRSRLPEARIGFFLHIPFPPQELFAQLPWRREIIEGLQGADLLGFQTPIGADNFLKVSRRFTHAHGSGDQLEIGGRKATVRSFPISIDFDQFNTLVQSDEVEGLRSRLRSELGNRRILLGIDRLDYTKGIDVRLEAFRTLLRSDPLLARRCVLIQIAVPSREHVDEYKRLRVEVERLVGEINGEFGQVGMAPVHYLRRSVPPADLAAFYSLADVMLVTPLRDGMNLVAKEYVASRGDERGVLILSEFTGAALELNEALLVNPHDVEGVAAAMRNAFQIPPQEQTRRMRAMRRTVRSNNVHHWAEAFCSRLGVGRSRRSVGDSAVETTSSITATRAPAPS